MQIRKFICIYCFFTIWCSIASFAQESAVVKGTVKDAKRNKPLPLANITVLGTTLGAATNEQGFYEIEGIPPGEYKLEANVIGYKKQIRGITVKAGDVLQLNFGLIPEIIELEGVTVGALRNNPMPVFQLEAKEIRKVVPTTAGEILQEVPGISVSRAGGWGTKPYFQGMTDSRILVFVDGVKVNQACPMGMDACTATLEPDLIASVDVQKGPGAAQYGSGNLGGVINISTISSRYSGSPAFKTEANFASKYKSVSNSRTGLLTFSGGNQKFDFIAGVNNGRHDDYQTKRGAIKNSGFQASSLHVKMRYRPATNQQLQFTTQSYRAKDIGWPASNTIIPKEKRETYALNYSVSDLSKKLQRITINVSYQPMFHNMSIRAPGNKQMLGDSKTDTYNADVVSNWSINSKNKISSGFYFSLWKMNAEREVVQDNVRLPVINILPDASVRELGVFIQEETNPSDRLKFQTGIRANFINSSAQNDSTSAKYQGSLQTDETVFSGSAALFYNINKNIAVYTSVSKGFKAATPVERYIAAPMIDGYYRIGNPDLASETNLSKRFGLKGMQNRVNWNLEIFHNNLSNLISAEVDVKTENPYQGLKGIKRFVNIQDAQIFGISAYAGLSLGRSFYFSADIAFDRGEDNVTGEPLPFIAPLNSTTKLTYDNVNKGYWLEAAAKLTAAQNRFSGRYGETSTPGFSVFDLRGGWKVRKNFEIIAGVENIFNKYYREHLNLSLLPEPGRSLFVTVNISVPTTGFRNKELNSQNAKLVTLAIDGMACQYCVKTVTERLSALPGVVSVNVSLAQKSARVMIDEEQVSVYNLISVIDLAGFKAGLTSIDPATKK